MSKKNKSSAPLTPHSATCQDTRANPIDFNATLPEGQARKLKEDARRAKRLAQQARREEKAKAKIEALQAALEKEQARLTDSSLLDTLKDRVVEAREEYRAELHALSLTHENLLQRDSRDAQVDRLVKLAQAYEAAITKWTAAK